MEMSACGRTVSVGLLVDSGEGADGEEVVVVGVMDERNKGHSCIASDRVLRRKGRYVRRLYFPVGGTSGGAGTG